MQTHTIVQTLIDKINTDFDTLGTYRAIYAYDEKTIEVPIQQTYIAFNTNENAVSFFENENEECCKRTKVEIKANFYAPPNIKTADTYTLAETLFDYLLIEYAGKMSGYNIGAIGVSDDLKAFKLPCTISFIYEQCPAYGDEGAAYKPFADFMCKTHVVDSNIHLTAEEKAYCLAPFVVGTFVGDGEPEQNVVLNFRPKFVILFGSGTAGFSIEDNTIYSYFAFSIGNKSTKGLEMLGNGFKVKMGTNVVSYGTRPLLNTLGQTYNYIAFK